MCFIKHRIKEKNLTTVDVEYTIEAVKCDLKSLKKIFELCLIERTSQENFEYQTLQKQEIFVNVLSYINQYFLNMFNFSIFFRLPFSSKKKKINFYIETAFSIKFLPFNLFNNNF